MVAKVALLGVILFGPPTSGKDTITATLSQLDPRFQLLRKLKSGSGRISGYRMIAENELMQLRECGRLVAETRRYGNIYAVDREDVTQMIDRGEIPVVHMGNIADIRRLSEAFDRPWLKVLLWISRETCAQRLHLEGDRDIQARLTAWDQTLMDIQQQDARGLFDLRIDTDQNSATSVATMIQKAWM